MKKHIIVLVGIILSGCASTSYLNTNEASIKKWLRYSGTAENISTNFLTDAREVVGSKKSFSFDDARVTWWGQVWDSTVLPLKLHAKWHAPQGNLYKEYDFIAMGNLSGIVSTALPIKNQISPSQQGLWKVTVCFRGIELSTVDFYIGAMMESNQGITDEELKKIFPDWDKADAVILLKETKVKVDKNYKTTTTIKRRIKIISDRGEKDYSVINIPFYSALEYVDVNMAHTIKTNGEIIEAKEMQMFSPFEEYPNYSESKILGIVMPSVEKGSVIEYEIETQSLMDQVLPSFWNEFNFNQDALVLNARYIVTCPENFDLKISNFNIECTPAVITDENRKTKTYTWEKSNFQAIQVEKNMPPLREVLSYINVHTSSSWQDIVSWWNDLSKDKIIANSEIVNKAKELTKNSSDKIEKIKWIFSFVQSEIRYVQVEFGASPYQPVSAIETFKNRYGDCKDQVSLLIAMLKSVGIEDAYYGIVRTKDAGAINRTAANPREFNHAIAVIKVNGREIFLDPTAKNMEFGVVPYLIQGTDVFVINEDAGYFTAIPVAEADDNQIESAINLNIDNELRINGKIKITYKGQYECFTRAYIEKLQPKQRDEYISSILADVYPGAKLKNYAVKYETSLDSHLEVEIDFLLQNWIEKVEGSYLVKVMNDDLVSPPDYVSLNRKFPVSFDFNNVTKSEIAITLPANLIVRSMPQDFSIASSNLVSSVQYSRSGNKITREQIIKNVAIDIPVQDILEYKDTWDQIFKAHRQGIVLSDR